MDFLNKKPLLVAEIGSGHEGNFDLAVQMVEAAAESGADVIKFQIYKAKELIHPILLSKQFERCLLLEFSEEQWKELFETARRYKIDFFASVFGDWGLKLVSQNCNWIKIASGDLNHLGLLRKVGNTRKKVILSTGMSTLDEIGLAIFNLGHDNICLLHCMSLYPCPPESANLSWIWKLREEFGLPVGYSDHCVGIDVAIQSLQYFPVIIEKHFTLTPELKIGDHPHSATPKMLSELRTAIEENSKKDHWTRFNNRSDMENRKRWRRGIYLTSEAANKKEITEDDMVVVRPEEGSSVSADAYFAVVRNNISGRI